MWNNEWVYFGRFETTYDDLSGYFFATCQGWKTLAIWGGFVIVTVEASLLQRRMRWEKFTGSGLTIIEQGKR